MTKPSLTNPRVEHWPLAGALACSCTWKAATGRALYQHLLTWNFALMQLRWHTGNRPGELKSGWVPRHAMVVRPGDLVPDVIMCYCSCGKNMIVADPRKGIKNDSRRIAAGHAREVVAAQCGLNQAAKNSVELLVARRQKELWLARNPEKASQKGKHQPFYLPSQKDLSSTAQTLATNPTSPISTEHSISPTST